MQELAGQTLSDGYQIAWTGSAYQEIATGGTGSQALIFGLIMVFLILAAQCERWSLPFAVVLAMPFALFGALVAIWLRGLNNDVYFQIGLVTLVGLVSKNAILIVEFAVLKRRARPQRHGSSGRSGEAALSPDHHDLSCLHSRVRSARDFERRRRRQPPFDWYRCYRRHVGSNLYRNVFHTAVLSAGFKRRVKEARGGAHPKWEDRCMRIQKSWIGSDYFWRRDPSHSKASDHSGSDVAMIRLWGQ